MSEYAIEVSNLHKRFGRKEVLKGLDLCVPKGSIYGLLGRNGEGKTTAIKAMLGLLKFDGGQCRVLGMDSARDGVEIRAWVGYMAENQVMYDWMTIRETCEWVAAFYPTWDPALSRELLGRFELDDSAKVGSLSKGQTSKLALMLALAHRPQVVILDDPTLGLDPVARKDFLREIIGQLQDRKITVLFSSHLLYEIDPICDHVAILDGGRIVRAGPTESLRREVKRFVVTIPREHDAVSVPGLLDAEVENHSAALVTEDWESAKEVLTAACASPVEMEDLNLDEIFEAYVIGRRAAGPFLRDESTLATAGGPAGGGDAS